MEDQHFFCQKRKGKKTAKKNGLWSIHTYHSQHGLYAHEFGAEEEELGEDDDSVLVVFPGIVDAGDGGAVATGGRGMQGVQAARDGENYVEGGIPSRVGGRIAGILLVKVGVKRRFVEQWEQDVEAVEETCQANIIQHSE